MTLIFVRNVVLYHEFSSEVIYLAHFESGPVYYPENVMNFENQHHVNSLNSIFGRLLGFEKFSKINGVLVFMQLPHFVVVHLLCLLHSNIFIRLDSLLSSYRVLLQIHHFFFLELVIMNRQRCAFV